MRLVSWTIAFLLLVAVCVSQAGPPQTRTPAAAALFEGARLILGDGKAPIENSAFIVENDDLPPSAGKAKCAPSGTAHIDLTGKTVMPALVDVHSHFGFLNQKDGSMSKANFNRRISSTISSATPTTDSPRRSAWAPISAICRTGCAKRCIPAPRCFAPWAAVWRGRVRVRMTRAQ